MDRTDFVQKLLEEKEDLLKQEIDLDSKINVLKTRTLDYILAKFKTKNDEKNQYVFIHDTNSGSLIDRNFWHEGSIDPKYKITDDDIKELCHEIQELKIKIKEKEHKIEDLKSFDVVSWLKEEMKKDV